MVYSLNRYSTRTKRKRRGRAVRALRGRESARDKCEVAQRHERARPATADLPYPRLAETIVHRTTYTLYAAN